MFPRLRQKLGTALVDRIDVLVEFSTLGEYALADDFLPVAMHADGCSQRPTVPAPMRDCLTLATSSPYERSRDDCPARQEPLSRRRSG